MQEPWSVINNSAQLINGINQQGARLKDRAGRGGGDQLQRGEEVSGRPPLYNSCNVEAQNALQLCRWRAGRGTWAWPPADPPSCNRDVAERGWGSPKTPLLSSQPPSNLLIWAPSIGGGRKAFYPLGG